jgi:WD40 repeat protein
VRLWGVKDQVQVHCFEGHKEGVLAVAFCPGGQQAISASKDGTFRVWQLPPEEQRKKKPPEKQS